jgi:hypothetical protein
MHLFRTAPLIMQLARGELSRTQKAYYLLASFLMFTLAYYSGFVGGSAVYTPASMFEGIATAVITVIGVVKCFDAAGGDDAPDFIESFTCLYVPVSITTIGVVWGLYWATLFGFRESLLALSESRMQFAINLAKLGTDIFGFLNFAAVVAVQMISFYRVASALEDVRILRSES